MPVVTIIIIIIFITTMNITACFDYLNRAINSLEKTQPITDKIIFFVGAWVTIVVPFIALDYLKQNRRFVTNTNCLFDKIKFIVEIIFSIVVFCFIFAYGTVAMFGGLGMVQLKIVFVKSVTQNKPKIVSFVFKAKEYVMELPQQIMNDETVLNTFVDVVMTTTIILTVAFFIYRLTKE